MRARSSRAERYHQEAERLRRNAEFVRDAETRIELLTIARKYDALASSVEQISGHFARALAKVRRMI